MRGARIRCQIHNRSNERAVSDHHTETSCTFLQCTCARTHFTPHQSAWGRSTSPNNINNTIMYQKQAYKQTTDEVWLRSVLTTALPSPRPTFSKKKAGWIFSPAEMNGLGHVVTPARRLRGSAAARLYGYHSREQGYLVRYYYPGGRPGRPGRPLKKGRAPAREPCPAVGPHTLTHILPS